MNLGRRRFSALAGGTLTAALIRPVRAQAAQLRIAKQFGLGYLQLMIMEDRRLVEKHVQAAGLGAVEVTWGTFRSSDVMNDALISGNLDFACLGLPGIATIWARTRTNIDVRAASGLNALPLYLLTRNPNVNSLRDFTDADRIALPAVRVSMQAILLQMACAQAFGESEYQRLDRLTVSMSHPDATAAMLGGASEITAHFTSPPFHRRQLANPRIRRLMTSTEILGGRVSFNVVAATNRFRSANPRLYEAFLAALEEATQIINADKPKAAEEYKRLARDPAPVEDLAALLNDPENIYTTDPLNIGRMVEFMHRTGQIRVQPASWRDLFFPNMHGRSGA
jgi:NitT/TauT family transport system substrate-binding protein